MDSSLQHKTTKIFPSQASRDSLSNRVTMISGAKPLAFSIERIMSRTPEPKCLPVPSLLQGSVPKGDQKQALHINSSSIPCMIPFVPVAYDHCPKIGISGAELRKSHLDSSPPFSCNDLLNCALTLKGDFPREALPLQQYKLVRPRVVNHSSFHAMGAAFCYFNRGDSQCHPPASINIHPVASYFLGSPLHQAPKSYLAERNKLVLPSVEKFSSGVTFKDLSQAQFQHYMKEGAHSLSDKITFKTSAKFSSASPSNKPKVFTCEVCGKASSFVRFLCLLAVAPTNSFMGDKHLSFSLSLKGVQRALQPDSAHAGAHRGPALCLQDLRQRIPPSEHPVPAQDHPYTGEATQVQPMRQSVQSKFHAEHSHPDPRWLQAICV
ncbi:hypothetical protein XENTR_v10008677 [Xenopus tropicalis]|nr:hypothetical protein XENTR_v10008677 [Xenopus tropicalis]